MCYTNNGIQQGGKTRVIDDCAVDGLNQTVGSREKFVLRAVDQMCATIYRSMRESGPGYFDYFSTLSRPELQSNTIWAGDSLFGPLAGAVLKKGRRRQNFQTRTR